MIKTAIESSGKDKLYMYLSSMTLSLNRRGVSVIPVAYSEHYGTIEIQVIGKLGAVKKFVIVGYDESTFEWLILTNKNQYRGIDLSSLNAICKSVIQNLGTLVSKI